MKIKTVLFFGFCALTLTTLSAPPTHAEESVTFGDAGSAAHVDRTVVVIMKDTAYSIKSLKVHSGETVRFIIKNHDDIDHEFTMGPKDIQAKDRADMKAMAEKGEEDTMTVPWAVSVPANKTKELIWKFAGPPTKIEFDCNIPGHYEAGMSGTIDITN